MSRILVVANKTLGSSDLLQSIRDRMTKGPCEFTLLVPVIPHAHRESRLEIEELRQIADGRTTYSPRPRGSLRAAGMPAQLPTSVMS
jgi:hypothetical protein